MGCGVLPSNLHMHCHHLVLASTVNPMALAVGKAHAVKPSKAPQNNLTLASRHGHGRTSEGSQQKRTQVYNTSSCLSYIHLTRISWLEQSTKVLTYQHGRPLNGMMFQAHVPSHTRSWKARTPTRCRLSTQIRIKQHHTTNLHLNRTHPFQQGASSTRFTNA